MIDDTIRLLIKTDADAEIRRADAKEKCSALVAEAKKNAAARSEARIHHTRDLIYEIEEEERAAYEQQYHALLEDYEHQSSMMTKQFEDQREPLLDTLVQQVLRRAEQSYGK